MANYHCRNDHVWLGCSRLSPRFSSVELNCPECGCRAESSLKQGGGFKADNESPARRAARQAFNRAVKQHGCFYSAYRTKDGKPRRKGHICTYPLDAHHIVEKNWIERNYADLSEDELLSILFDPRIGIPLCRNGHANVANLRIFWDEVSGECKEACREVDQRWLEMPAERWRRRSMYEELRRVCPKRKMVAIGGEGR